MQFFEEGLTPKQLRRGVSAAGIALSVGVALFGAEVAWYRSQARIGYLLAAVGAVAAVTALGVFYQLWYIRRNGRLAFGPLPVFFFALAGMVAIALIAISVPSPRPLFEVSLAVPVVFIAIVGDRFMQVIGWAAAMAMLVWSALLTHTHGAQLGALIVVGGGTITVSQQLVLLAVKNFKEGKSSQVARRVLMDAVASAESIDEGLVACLPLVDGVLPCRRAVAIAWSDEYGPTVLAAWPEGQEEDRAFVNDAEFADALRRSEPVITPGRCYVPCGYVTDGELVLVTERTAGTLAEDFTAGEDAAAVASSFLRMTGRLAAVSLLRELSSTDPLTGLANRRTMWDRLETEIARSARNGTPFSIAMIDIDHFKRYNDQHGHVAGDELLRDIAGMMAGRLRAQDLLARYGGEEFCAILPDTDVEGAWCVMEVLRRSAREVSGKEPVTVSAGIAGWNNDEDAPRLISRADAALYRAKRDGRDRVLTEQEPATGERAEVSAGTARDPAARVVPDPVGGAAPDPVGGAARDGDSLPASLDGG